MGVVNSARIREIEATYKRPIAALLSDLIHKQTYTKTCEQLKISRRTLIYWMEKHNIQGPGRGGRSCTPEYKNKVSASLRGKPRPPEVREKISKKLSGRILSSDTKKRISKSLKRAHRKRREGMK